MGGKRGGEPGNEASPAKRAKRSDDERAEFLRVFESLSEEAIADIPGLPDLSPALVDNLQGYYKQCVEYTVPGGKLTRGLTVVKGCEVLLGEMDAATRLKANALGWCVEWLQAMFLVADDVMDKSLTRRGKPCWYKLPHVTVANAVNDTLMLETLMYRMLRRHFRDDERYPRLLAHLQDATWYTEVGQHLDTNATPFDTPLDLSRFTLDRHRAIVRYKTAYYSFNLSCAFALEMSGDASPENLERVKLVCLELGEFFQVQDDYLDCYGDPEVIGKVGTDIQDAKCSWLVCKALEVADADQRKCLEDNYGKWDDECVGKVKAVFKALDLEAEYRKYEEEAKAKIDALIANVEPAKFRPLLEFLLGKIYKRDK